MNRTQQPPQAQVDVSELIESCGTDPPEGFTKAGGFKGVYNGCFATALGAAPGSAFFFSAYEGMKPRLAQLNGGKEHPLHHSTAASFGARERFRAQEAPSP